MFLWTMNFILLKTEWQSGCEIIQSGVSCLLLLKNFSDGTNDEKKLFVNATPLRPLVKKIFFETGRTGLPDTT